MKSTRKMGGARVLRERENLEMMMRLFCQEQHHRDDLCTECQQLLDYSKAHLQNCKLGLKKPVCENHSFGCYAVGCRDQLQIVIGATRTRMFWKHPQISLRHWLDRFYHEHPTPRGRDCSSWGSE